MHDHSDAQAARQLRPARLAEERPGPHDRREPTHTSLRPAEEPTDGANHQGVTWRWHVRRRRER